MSNKLAINGGQKIRSRVVRDALFPRRELANLAGVSADMMALLDENKLSSFRGSNNENFYGGEWVKALEGLYKKEFPGREAISVNSATSGLHIACHAIGLKPGDEVIVTPWSMSCSASAPLVCGATPVFADIEMDYYCLDPKSVREKITKRTKAIIVVDLFGQGYSGELDDIAEEHGLYIIEDAAQAIGSDNYGGVSGTRGDIGIFSFTQGKHVSAGEGGMMLVKDWDLAFRCQLLRNHAEAVQGDMLQQGKDVLWPDLYGYNMRMTEMSALVAYHESRYFFDAGLENIITRTTKLIKGLCENVPIISPPKIRHEKLFWAHSYYVLAFQYEHESIHRDTFIAAVKAELAGEEGRPDKGVPINAGYIMPLYKNPLFANGERTPLPNVEKLQSEKLFLTTLQLLPLTNNDIDDIIEAFVKVYENMGELV